VVASFDDARALDTAFTGAKTLLLLTPPHARATEWGSAAVAAAKKAGISRIVRISAILASANGPSDNSRQHGRTDDEVRRSGIASVILRPHFFMQNLLADVDSLRSKGTLYAAAGDASLGMIDARDIADVARRTLLDSAWDGTSQDLTGPASISFHEIVRTLSRLLGREIRYVPITPAALAQSIREMGIGEWFAQVSHDYLQAYSDGWGDFTTDSVREISGQPARSFAQFAEGVLIPALKATHADAETPVTRAPS